MSMPASGPSRAHSVPIDVSGLAGEMDDALRQSLAAWFPRCLDKVHCGYLCDFDHRWRESGRHRKTLEFQARQTELAVQAATFFPENPTFRAYADHGFRYLRDVLWDSAERGWYRVVSRVGQPEEGATKHAHGTAYGISACCSYHALTGDDVALALAMDAFGWLEKHAHDDIHGGYFGPHHRDGRTIRTPVDNPLPYPLRDVIGTPIGLKDTNTHSDLLGAFASLYALTTDGLVGARIHEILTIVRKHIVVAPGIPFMHFQPDWKPIPDLVHYGQTLDLALELGRLACVLEPPAAAEVRALTRSMVDTVLLYAWDHRNGGIHMAGSAYGPAWAEDVTLFFPDKVWWTQTGGLELLLSLALEHPDSHYGERFLQLWRYVRKHLIDARHGGWFRIGTDCRDRKQPKATEWKHGLHECQAMMRCIDRLSRVGEKAGQTVERGSGSFDTQRVAGRD